MMKFRRINTFLCLFSGLVEIGAVSAAEQPKETVETRRIKVSANTANLEEYRKLAEFAKELGATHCGADQIEPSMWQWNQDRYDPYPNWSLYRPSLFKYIVPKELKKYLPEDYAKRNLKTLIEHEKVLKDLYKKIEIMENHRRDLLRVYKDYNR